MFLWLRNELDDAEQTFVLPSSYITVWIQVLETWTESLLQGS